MSRADQIYTVICETVHGSHTYGLAAVLERSPVLLRLKELEALEKVAERIDKLTVFGGLDGVLQGLVKFRAESQAD